MAFAGIDAESLESTLKSLWQFADREVNKKWRLEQDAHHGEFPREIVKRLMDEIGLQLTFIPESCGGLGCGAYDIYRISETMAAIDLGLATAFLAISLGSDPILVGGTQEQKEKWMGRVANECCLVAYGVTEPTVGSDLGALKSRAVKFQKDGQDWYRINGAKQFITNGGVADFTTILAATDAGPTFFIVENNTPGFSADKPEDKHGIRVSNTCALTLDNVEVPAENLVGGVEGKGLAQAQAVFGYTRLMVAAFGLGAGEAAMKLALQYSRERVQGGSLLGEKQAFTHKLLVPHAVRLAGARAYIEYVADRLDSGEADLQTEGAIAKLIATEYGNGAADAAIQAHGGYGYTREYEVEKIKRDARITTIYEGTSEINEWTIARDRWQQHLKTGGGFYAQMAQDAAQLAARAPNIGADIVAYGVRALREVFERCRAHRLTRHQHVLFRLGDFAARIESALSLCHATQGRGRGPKPAPEVHQAMARVYAREMCWTMVCDAMALLRGCDLKEDRRSLETALCLGEISDLQVGKMTDMDLIAKAIVALEPKEAVAKTA